MTSHYAVFESRQWKLHDWIIWSASTYKWTVPKSFQVPSLYYIVAKFLRNNYGKTSNCIYTAKIFITLHKDAFIPTILSYLNGSFFILKQ